MPAKRTMLFLILYAAIIAAILFMFFFVQAHFSADIRGPFKKKLFDKFMMGKPAHPAATPTFPLSDPGFRLLPKTRAPHSYSTTRSLAHAGTPDSYPPDVRG
jgi:hypothetical protein